MRLIDADTLVKNIESAIENGYGVTVGEVIATIEYAPTIDAVPVVRCKDCRWKDQELPDHGDLIDREVALYKANRAITIQDAIDTILDAPTVIPAERSNNGET